MGVRITTLTENTAGQPDILAEWGASFFIEADGKNILLDAGASISLTRNAKQLQIDLQKIDKIVLSHGHVDHTGGLRRLLRQIRHEVEVIAHPDIWNREYSRREGRPDRFIGVPFSKSALESLGAKFTLSRGPIQLSENVMTTGEIPMVTDFETVEKSFFVKTRGGWQPDKLLDDLALIIKTASGLAIVLGCGHRGMINTLYHAQNLARTKKIRMVLGGCHLVQATDEQIWQTISALNEMEVPKLALSHCTGIRATIIMAQTYGANFVFNNAGTIINLG